MKNKKIQFITETAIFSALAIVFDVIAALMFMFVWPNGGSISIAMIPILIMGYKWGLKGGLLTGFVTGAVQIIWAGSFGGYLTLTQAIIEYPLAYMIIGLTAIFCKQVREEVGIKQALYIIIPLFVACLLKAFLHIVCGVYYWGLDFLGSTIYNTPYALISFVLVAVLSVILVKRLKRIIILKEE